jgi:hypothetical protein
VTTVTGLTADRMLAIEAASVVDGDVDASGNLILTQHGGTQINAGNVKGPPGPQGPVGSMLSVVTAQPVLDIGIINQIRAGRQLTAADFTNMGLSAPVALWNLSDVSDASGNGRVLLNKGAVPFTSGINGGANTAALLTGSTAQALYISDTGAADPFRIKTGSLGCWFKTAKLGTPQDLIAKWGVSPQFGYVLTIANTNIMNVFVSSVGSDAVAVAGVTNVCDDCWHFVVSTYDGTAIKLYVDGILEAMAFGNGSIFGSTSPLNIGSRQADSSNVAVQPSFGRIDETFITSDVLSDDQVRNLYCAKISHTLGAPPARVSLSVRRSRKGAALASSDFTTQPLRLHNFSGGSLGDTGSGGVALTNNGGALAVSGVDGASGNAFNFNAAQSLSSTDAGLPAATAARSYGCWVKTNVTGSGNVGIVSWGTGTGAAAQTFYILLATGVVSARGPSSDDITGLHIVDGQWHFLVCTEDNAAADGLRRKFYIDGRLIGSTTVLNAITLGGASRFRIGSYADGSGNFTGQIDSVFVCGYALTGTDVAKLYAKGSMVMSPSPKNVGDHIEGMDSNNLFATFDTLDTNVQIDMAVAP